MYYEQLNEDFEVVEGYYLDVVDCSFGSGADVFDGADACVGVEADGYCVGDVDDGSVFFDYCECHGLSPSEDPAGFGYVYGSSHFYW